MVYDIPNRICPHRNLTICKSADGKFNPMEIAPILYTPIAIAPMLM